MTDAEILRTLAGEGSCDPYLGYIAPMYAFDVQRKKDTDFDAARKVDVVAKALFDRAAAAIEENARLRAAIESVEQLQRWANEMTHYHKGEWVLYADVIAALRKPDAAE